MILEALDVAQRKRRAMVFKRIKFKIQAAKKRNQSKLASDDKIKIRARKGAINIIRKKVAGNRGENYKNLSTGEKVAVDKLVAQKRSMIAKLSNRLVPVMRKKEKERLQKFKSNSNTRNEEMQTYSALMEKIQRLDESRLKVKQGKMSFGDGSSTTISGKDAKMINAFIDEVSSSNLKQAEEKLTKSKESFNEFLAFIRGTMS